MIDKERIKQCFQRAAATYEQEAVIQQRVADHLLGLLQACNPGQVRRVLEIGCCTGLLTRRITGLYNDIHELVLNDLVEEFALRAGDQPGIAAVRFLAGDIESLELPGTFDLIISSSTFHWVHDLQTLLAKLSAHLAPGGTLAFSLYGPKNLQEIRTTANIGLEYADLDTVRAMLEEQLSVLHCEQQQEVFFFNSPEAVLEHLRRTGVNALPATPWTPGRLQRFSRQYRELFSGPQGVRLTYHPLYLVARRRTAA